VTSRPATPDQNGFRSGRMLFAVSYAVAKPRSSDPPDRLMTLLTTPMTSPFVLKTGPPESPELTAASVCKNSTDAKL
jgi:hypothetical protein